MSLQIYQMEVHQKAPPKVKHAEIIQKSPNWSQQLENIKSLHKKKKNLKKILKHSSKPCSIEKMGLQIYQMEAYQKAPPKVKHINFTQKSPDCSLELKNIRNL